MQKDNWNDYSFRTLYGLYYNPEGDDSELVYIGGVKILRRGQTAADPLQVNDPFDYLGPEFCSVGTSLDYYERLSNIRPSDRHEIVTALNDVIANSQLSVEFMAEPGWEKSLFRDNSEWERFLDDATAVFNNTSGQLPDISTEFSFRPSKASDELNLNFDAPEPKMYSAPYRRVGPSRKEVLLPRRIVALIGRNGSGKSTLLARLAHVAFASKDARMSPSIRAMGKLTPPDLNFFRVITVSYSAFDNFTVPGLDARDKRQQSLEIERGQGRFVYCGLRDIAEEARENLAYDAYESHRIREAPRQNELGHQRKTYLKSIDKLADEFDALVKRIKSTGRRSLFQAALEPIFVDPSFSQLSELEPVELLDDNPRQTFMDCSTGHKIALHVVASLVANATRKSLVLFDEPETHLHPPLAAALMHSLRIILEETNAFCIAATHSPVVVQETLARHVRIVTRSGDEMQFSNPRLETFGENLGVLTYDIFGLTVADTDFHEVLNLLVKGTEEIEEIDTLFDPGLSTQARAYILSKLAMKKRAN
ncbi:AAA family ATPase [Thalassobaculum sp. OXR-137]|uniref:ATP-binding protein n=1 Tax=Thalassobaculum sp. OXR-137 TaxID=3100173 RepID=UPI002AC9502E|nr:AAA family ATPase [Thalassobaculum sp. OXR-137]WPZ34520.1 AAA family ATPase [Thalassobaculum sp. OXR-137]